MGPEATQLNLTFHGLGPVPRAVEAGERAVWVGTPDFHAILDAVGSEPGVLLTFDDGNASDAEIALPALAERGLGATFFALAGKLGGPGYLDAAGVRALSDAGMRIGTHGMDHRSWRGLSPADTERELGDARRRLEDLCGAPVDEASCPFGAYDRGVLGALRRHGYRRVFTSDRLPARADAWFQPRFTVHAGDDADTVRGWLRGGPALERAVRRAKVFLKQRRG